MVGENSRALPALRKAAFASVSVAALLLGYSTAAFADGGAGGDALGGPAGSGGATSTTGTGVQGRGGTGFSGGGGGGAGVTGGGGGGGIMALGGAGGATAGSDGQDGDSVQGSGGAGGGGGAHGAVTGGRLNDAPVQGGKGGNGGAGQDLFRASGGGGGGAGGYGTVATSTAGFNNSSTITGGAGGNGGGGDPSNGGNGGNGGSGGIGLFAFGGAGSSIMVNDGSFTGGKGGNGGGAVGIYVNGNGGAGGAGFSSNAASLLNNGSITGGNGGATGNSGGNSGTAGAGGVGIIGSDLSIINTGTITGGLSGSGVRANAITFTGGTNSLALYSTSSITGNVVAFSAADTLRLGGGTNGTFSLDQLGTQYQGFGTIGKSGASTWTVTGFQNTHSVWSITGGTIKLDSGNTTASVSTTVGDGGTLTGNGAIGTATFESRGTFAPGSVPGTSTLVVGGLTMQARSTFQVSISPTDNTFASVVGTATLAGTATALFAPGTYMQNSYRILEASLVTGSFSSLTTTDLPSGFTASLTTVDDKKVMLNLTAVLGSNPLVPGSNLNPNQSSVAGGLNNYFNNGGTLPPNFTSLFGLTGSALSSALSQLSGEPTTGSRVAGTQLSSRFLGAVLDPTANGRSFGGATPGGGASLGGRRGDLAAIQTLSDAGDDCDFAPEQPRWSIWSGGFGGGGVNNGNAGSGASSVTAATYGFVAGIDYNYSRDTVFGVAISTGGSDWWLGNGLGQGRSTTLQAALYGLMREGPAYLSVGASFANHQMTTNRSAMGDQLTATFNGQSYGARAEAGYRFEVAPKTGIAPYVAGQYQLFHTPAYSETDISGLGFGLSYGASDSTYTRTEIGARLDTTTELDGRPLVLRSRLGWAHDFVNTPGINASFNALPGSSFIVTGTTPPPDSALVSVSAEYTLQPRLTLGTKFDGEFSGQAQSYAGMLTLRYDL
jgi:uncharacterized protein with beta-barrel porin domain